jgi:hypothetical protein
MKDLFKLILGVLASLFKSRAKCSAGLSLNFEAIASIISMYDFARQIAAGEIFPSLAFSFKPLDPTVLVHQPPVPECVKRAIG